MVSAVKANIGHSEAASGLASLIKAVMVLQHGQAPPNLHLKTLSPNIVEAIKHCPVHFPTKLESLQNDSDNTVEGRRKQLIAGVNSFGIGGTLAQVLLSEGTKKRMVFLPISQYAKEVSFPVFDATYNSTCFELTLHNSKVIKGVDADHIIPVVDDTELNSPEFNIEGDSLCSERV